MKYLIHLVEDKDNRELIDYLENDKRVYSEKLNDGDRLVFFYSDMADELLCHFKNTAFYDLLHSGFNNSKQVCPFCQSHTNRFLINYRDNGGCVGKSVECIVCKSINSADMRSVRDAVEKGNFKTVETIFDIKFNQQVNKMYDKNQQTTFHKPTVAQIISRLSELPPDAQITICGDDNCYIHVETDNSVVNMDNEPLDECYEDNGNGA